MHDDPLVFTLRDWVSRIVMILAALVLALAVRSGVNRAQVTGYRSKVAGYRLQVKGL